MIEIGDTVFTALLTGGFAVLGSSGFWNMRIKKLEIATKNNETTEKIDKMMESVDKMQKTLEDMQHEHRKSDDLLMAVARDRIYHLCKKFTREKDTDPDNMRDLTELLEPYEAKGGDGLAHEYFETYKHMFINNSGKD